METGNPENADYIRIAGLDNAIEAQLLASVLAQHGIPHRIRSHRDTAYDGLFQVQKGWGEISAPMRWKKEITEILEQLRGGCASGGRQTDP